MYASRPPRRQENTLHPRGNGNRVFSVISQNKGGKREIKSVGYVDVGLAASLIDKLSIPHFPAEFVNEF